MFARVFCSFFFVFRFLFFCDPTKNTPVCALFFLVPLALSVLLYLSSFLALLSLFSIFIFVFGLFISSVAFAFRFLLCRWERGARRIGSDWIGRGVALGLDRGWYWG